MSTTDSNIELYGMAQTAALGAYTPHSQFNVGAAIRFENGHVATGANSDNASYPLALCAERAAIASGTSLGMRTIQAVAVHGPAESVSPCGGCRQVLAEFAAPDCEITFPWKGELLTIPFRDLLPYTFTHETSSP